MTKFNRHNTRSAKITPQDVVYIRQRYNEGATQGELAREFALSIGTIGRIVRGESWAGLGVTEPPPAEIQSRAIQSQQRLSALLESPGLDKLNRVAEAIAKPNNDIDQFLNPEATRKYLDDTGKDDTADDQGATGSGTEGAGDKGT